MINKTIGVLGGFGGYATLSFYQRFLEVFKGDNERAFPHIIFDNNFQMPSRTRALLTGDDYGEVVEDITRSFEFLLNGVYRADVIILACGTAHYFLPDVYKRIPSAEKSVLDIINTTGNLLMKNNIKQIMVIATEGTLSKRLYEDRLSCYGVQCVVPEVSDYAEIRFFIECVKQNEYTQDVKDRFIHFLEKYGMENVLLGCTEFPVLIRELVNVMKADLSEYIFYDPLEITLNELKIMIDNDK